MTLPLTKDLIARHEQYVGGHTPIPTFEEIFAEGGGFPPVAVITCADPRCIPERFFKLDIGEVIVYRTPGGKPEGIINGILSVDSLAKFKEIIIVQHTDCGATFFRDASIKEGLKTLAPAQEAEVDKMAFGQITIPLDESVRNSIKFLQDSPYIRPELKQNISGFVYDLKTGKLNPVAA